MLTLQYKHQSSSNCLRQDDRLLADIQPPQAVCGYHCPDVHRDPPRGQQEGGGGVGGVPGPG